MKEDKDLKAIYVSKQNHKKIKMFCTRHDIKSIQSWAEPILMAALLKPSREERLQRAKAEMEADILDLNENKIVEVKLSEGITATCLCGRLDCNNDHSAPANYKLAEVKMGLVPSLEAVVERCDTSKLVEAPEYDIMEVI